MLLKILIFLAIPFVIISNADAITNAEACAEMRAFNASEEARSKAYCEGPNFTVAGDNSPNPARCTGIWMGLTTKEVEGIERTVGICNTYAHCGGYPEFAESVTFQPSSEAVCGRPENRVPLQVQMCSATTSGSIIQISSQVLGEAIPVQGSSFDLIYFSNRVMGRIADYSLVIPVNQEFVIPEVTNFEAKVFDMENNVLFTQPIANLLHQQATYIWDGKDQNVETWGSVNRIYKLTEYSTDRTQFEYSGKVSVGSFKAKKLGLGGWVPSIWHFYDDNSKVLYLGDGSQRTVEAVVDGSFKRIASANGTEVYYFDNIGRIVQTKTGLTGVTLYSFTYDSAGRLLKIEEPFNQVTTFSRYLNGNLKAIIAPNSAKTSIKINSNGYLAKAIGLNAETFEITYTIKGLLVSFKKPNGAISTMTYDSSGNLLTDIHSSGFSTSLNKVPNGVTSTTVMGRVTRAEYNPIFNREGLYKADGSFESNVNNSNTSSSQTGFNNFMTNYIDDLRFGKQVKSTSQVVNMNFGSRNTTISKTADLANPSDPFSFSILTEKIQTANSELNVTYNASTKTKESVTKLGKTSKVQLDNYERPIHAQKGNMVVSDFTYSDDLLTLVTQGTRKLVMSYYSNKLLKSVRNTLGQVTTFTYDNAHRLSSTVLPDNRIISYTYDSQNNLTSLRASSSRLNQITYGANEKISKFNPPAISGGTLQTPTTYFYNNDRQITKIVRPDQQEISFDYDATTGLLNSAGGIYYGYNQGRTSYMGYYGNAIFADYIGDQVSSYTLKDSTNNVISTYSRTPDLIAGEKVGSETINAGSNSSIAQTINYSYDDDEYLTNAGEMELSYNSPNGQLESTKLGSVRDYYYYNNFGEIRAYKAKFQSDEIYSYNLERDSVGRIIKKTEVLNNITKIHEYVYDSVGRLTQVSLNGNVDSTYNYDVNGNRLGGSIRGEATVGLSNAQDQVYSYNGNNYGYNLNGERTYKAPTTNATPETTYYTQFDPMGNLTRFQNGSKIIEYDLDPQLNRLRRKYNGEVKAGYIYNPEGKLVGEFSDNGALVKTFVYASKSHVPDYYIDANNNKFRIITDHLGSVRLLVAVNSGRVLKVMEHDEFGRVLQDTRPGFLPFGFAGGIYDKDTELVKFGVREYDPKLGRWMSKDPIRFNGGDTNLYGYVMQDPINLIDPSGLTPGDKFNGYIFGAANYVVGAGYGVFGATYQTMGYAGGVTGGAAGYAVSIPVNLYNQARLNPQRVNFGSETYSKSVNWGNDNASSSYGQMSKYFKKGDNLFSNGYAKGCSLNGK